MPQIARRRLLPALLPLLPLLALGLLVTAAAPAAAGPRARGAALVGKLRTQRLENVRFEDASLEEVLGWLRIATGSNFVLKRAALARAGLDPADIAVTLTLEKVTPATLLRLVLEPHDLAAQVKGNVVYVTTRVDALGKPVTRIYAISHITWTKTDFIAPDINLYPSNFAPPEEYVPEVIVEDDPLSTGDVVAELLQDLVAPGEWDNEGWVVRATDRYLVVRAPPSVQAKIGRALAQIASLK